MGEDSTSHFRYFAAALEAELGARAKMKRKEAQAVQRQQIEGLMELEERWRKAVVRHRFGKRVYDRFVAHICTERRNILAARPYFRERQRTFMRQIAPVLRRRAGRGLQGFGINFAFIAFAMAAAPWRAGSPVAKLAVRIQELRREVVTTNLPLAISRARIFWGRTQKSHLSFMDLIGIATEGLHAAVDKFVGRYSKVFCSVAIGRMVGNFIDEYSETHLHFYPSDRRKLYRANRFASRNPGYEIEALVAAVNEGVSPRQRTTEAEIRALMLAASTVSTDSTPPQQEEAVGSSTLATYSSPAEERPDALYEAKEARAAFVAAAAQLSLFERKLLRLRGVPVALTS